MRSNRPQTGRLSQPPPAPVGSGRPRVATRAVLIGVAVVLVPMYLMLSSSLSRWQADRQRAGKSDRQVQRGAVPKPPPAAAPATKLPPSPPQRRESNVPPPAPARPASQSNTQTTDVSQFPRLSPEQVPQFVEKLSLNQKIGQMLMVDFAGMSVGPVVQEIESLGVGSILFHKYNIGTQQRTKYLISEMQRVSLRTNSGIGLLLATDEEGGRVTRIPAEWRVPPTPNPAPSVLGNREVEDTGEAAQQTAKTFNLVGLNMNLAPVLDVLTESKNPIMRGRCFGSNPKTVARHGVAYILEMHKHGIVTTAKHFPGHGPTTVDSHHNLPYVLLSFDAWKQDHYAPFRRAVQEAGVDAIMTAHVAYQFKDHPTALDGRLPATLTGYFTQTVLRESLGFQGILITDALDMGAIRKNFTREQAYVQAVQNGVDMLILNGGPRVHRAARDALLKAVRDKRISEARVNEAVRRILTVKARHGLVAEHYQ